MTDPRLGSLRAALAGLAPVDGREEASLRRFVHELDRLPSPFDRDADPVHVTASALVVGPRGVILHRHKRLGLWLQPGGHLDPGEWPYDAARREVQEETGLPVLASLDPSAPVAHVDVHGGGLGHVHLDVRYVLAADGDPVPPADESQDVRWFRWDEALAIADAGLRGLLMARRPSAPSVT